MKTILITGSSGFIGEYLAKKFKEFYKVIGIDKNNDHQKNCHLFYKSDIRDFKKIKKCFEENKIDYIIHLAAEKSVLRCEENKDLAFKINFEASKFIYELSKKHGSKFIFMSSDQVFDGEKGDFFEDDPISPINYYGKLKADMEKVITYDLMKKSFLNSVICRTALDFGKIPTIQK